MAEEKKNDPKPVVIPKTDPKDRVKLNEEHDRKNVQGGSKKK